MLNRAFHHYAKSDSSKYFNASMTDGLSLVQIPYFMNIAFHIVSKADPGFEDLNAMALQFLETMLTYGVGDISEQGE